MAAAAASTSSHKPVVTYNTCPAATLHRVMVIGNKSLSPGSSAKGVVDFMQRGIYFKDKYPTSIYEKHLPPDTIVRLALFLGDDLTKWPVPTAKVMGFKTGIFFERTPKTFSVEVLRVIPGELNTIFKKVSYITSSFFSFTPEMDQLSLLAALIKYEKFLNLLEPLEAKITQFKWEAERRRYALPPVVGKKKPPLETYQPTAQDIAVFDQLVKSLEQ